MNLEFNKEYYFDEYKSFNEFVTSFLELIKGKKIKSFFPTGALWWSENYGFTDRVYNTDTENLLIFDDDTVLIFDYDWFSIINVQISKFSDIKKNIEINDNFDFDCYGESIVDYELNRFSDEYIIDPSTDKTRPVGGDYFKELIFHLSNGKKICICAENAESDGYCNIWMENDSLKGVFNGQSHETWWNQSGN